MIFGNSRKGQEEMIGFGVIIVIVAIIGLVFLWLTFNSSPEENFDSYEVTSFLHVLNQYTTDCKPPGRDYLKMQDLYYYVYDEGSRTECGGNIDEKELMDETIDGIMESSWNVGEDSPVKGYNIKINVLDLDYGFQEELYSREEGVINGTMRGAKDRILKQNHWYEIIFRGYY